MSVGEMIVIGICIVLGISLVIGALLQVFCLIACLLDAAGIEIKRKDE